MGQITYTLPQSSTTQIFGSVSASPENSSAIVNLSPEIEVNPGDILNFDTSVAAGGFGRYSQFDCADRRITHTHTETRGEF